MEQSGSTVRRPNEGGKMAGGANAVAARAVTDVLETDEAKGLIASAQEAGSVRAEDVVAALGELELDTAQLDEIFSALEELNVEVVGGRHQAASSSSDSSQRSKSVRRMRISPLGSLMQRGARPLARQS